MDFVFLGFNLYAWITILTVLSMFTVLLLTKLRADLVFLGAIAILFVTGVLNAKEAFSGFSSTSVVIIGVLFVVVAGLTHTGVLQWIVKHLLGQPESYSKAVIRLMLPVAGLSSFLSNTTVVALFVGIVKMWSKKLGVSPSKLLIPLSYASGMGGVCTLIGTPPNLIISGLYAENTGVAMKQPPFQASSVSLSACFPLLPCAIYYPIVRLPSLPLSPRRNIRWSCWCHPTIQISA